MLHTTVESKNVHMYVSGYSYFNMLKLALEQ